MPEAEDSHAKAGGRNSVSFGIPAVQLSRSCRMLPIQLSRACSIGLLGGFIRSSSTVLFFVFLLMILLRRTWITVVVVFVIFTAGGAAIGTVALSPISLIIGALLYSSLVIVLLRYGIVAFAASSLFSNLLMGFPITTQLSAWYSGIGLTGLALLLALTLYAFHTSLGGQAIFGRATLED